MSNFEDGLNGGGGTMGKTFEEEVRNLCSMLENKNYNMFARSLYQNGKNSPRLPFTDQNAPPSMFWVWMEWQLAAWPHSVRPDWDGLKINETTREFVEAEPKSAWSYAVALEIADEDAWEADHEAIAVPDDRKPSLRELTHVVEASGDLYRCAQTLADYLHATRPKMPFKKYVLSSYIEDVWSKHIREVFDKTSEGRMDYTERRAQDGKKGC